MHLDDIAAWKRLGRAVAARRADLGLNQGDLKDRGGPALSSVQAIEGGWRDAYRDRTLVDLERALGWKRGSVEAILFSDAEPVLIEPAVAPRSSAIVEAILFSDAEPVLIEPAVAPRSSAIVDAILADPDLLPEAKQHLISQLGLLRRIQRAPSPIPEPVTAQERAFVQQGQADLDTNGLHLVENGDATSS